MLLEERLEMMEVRMVTSNSGKVGGIPSGLEASAAPTKEALPFSLCSPSVQRYGQCNLPAPAAGSQPWPT